MVTRFVMDGERIHNVLPPFHRDQLFSSALATNQVNPPPSAVTAPGPGLVQGVGLGNLRIPPVVAGSGLGTAQEQGLGPAPGLGLGLGSGAGLGDNKDMLSASSQVVRQMDVINHGVTKPSSRWLGNIARWLLVVPSLLNPLLFPPPYHYTYIHIHIHKYQYTVPNPSNTPHFSPAKPHLVNQLNYPISIE